MLSLRLVRACAFQLPGDRVPGRGKAPLPVCTRAFVPLSPCGRVGGPAEGTSEAGLTADSSYSASRFVSIQDLPPSNLRLPLKGNRWRRPSLPLPPVSSAPIKAGMESIGRPAPLLHPFQREEPPRGPSRNLAGWASTFPLLSSRPPPIRRGCCCCSWQLAGGHGSGYRAGTCSIKRARGRVLGLLGDSSGTLRARVRRGKRGFEMDFDPNVLALRPGRQSPAKCLQPPLR